MKRITLSDWLKEREKDDVKFIVNSRNNYDTLVAVAQRLLDTLYAVENYLACNNDWSGKARHKQVNKAIADCEKLIKGEK